MDHRHRPDGPAAPPGGEPARWVVAGEEDGGRPPGGRDQPRWDAPTYDPGYGGARYDGPAEFPEHPDPGSGYPDSGYPDAGYPDSGYREPGIAGPGYRSGHHYPRPAPADPGGYPPAHPADGRLDPAYPPEPPTRLQPPVRHPGPRRPPAAPEPPAEPEPPLVTWLPALLWTVVLFVVPALLYLGWTLTLSDTAPAGCVDAASAPCPPPRTEAVDRLVDVLPGLGGALAIGLLVALGLRRIAADWRDATVGLAAAVIGAALATLVGTVVS